MEKIGLVHKPKHKPHGITKADQNARKSKDLLRRDFSAEKPLKKAVTDITEIKAKDGKLYVPVIFDCFDLAVMGISMDTNTKAALCVKTLNNAITVYPMLKGAVLHSDKGTQYVNKKYRRRLHIFNIVQSMNSDSGRCHDNARCESMRTKMKTEHLYGRYDTEQMTTEQLNVII